MKTINQKHHMSRLRTRKYLAAILMLCGFLGCLAGPLLACDPDPPCEGDADCDTGEECCGATCITECDNVDCMECDEFSEACVECPDQNNPYCSFGACRECRLGHILDCPLCHECRNLGDCVHNCDLSVCYYPNFCDTSSACFCVRCEIDYQCRGESVCHTCVDNDCVGCASSTPWCKESDGTCINCDSASAGDCSVTDEDIGFDADDCVSDWAGNGQCRGGPGGHIAAWDQLSSTDEDATGPNTEDADGCAIVQHVSCKNILVDPLQLEFDCVPDYPTLTTENMGTHEICPP